jgi:hypothetical protein
LSNTHVPRPEGAIDTLRQNIPGVCDLNLLNVHPSLATAMTRRPFAPRVLYQDAAHRFGRRAEEMAASIPIGVVRSAEPQVG